MASPVAPTISATGISAPTFADILNWLKSTYLGIYGADSYLGNDSQDYQYISAIAQAMADQNAACVAVYNAFSPATAQGNGLSSNVKINGLTRQLPSASTCDLTIVGVAGTTITNGQAQDVNGNVWALPASVTIPSGGSILVTATCQTQGAITASAATITKIKTPVYGWQTVNNAGAAVAGNPVETDAALRARQSLSVAAPSMQVFDGVLASIAQILGVTRSRGYENNTNATDGNGIPSKNVAIFAEGGDQLTIAQTIATKLPPGIPMQGALTNTIVSASGSSKDVKFSRPTNAVIHVALTLKALTGWSTNIEPIIAQAVADYLNTLPIGEPVQFFPLSVPARILGSPYASAFSLSSMTTAKNAGGSGTIDLALAYNEVPFGASANVTFTIV